MFALAKRQQYKLTVTHESFNWLAATLRLDSDSQHWLTCTTSAYRRNNRA
jgi:hypothetical protein